MKRVLMSGILLLFALTATKFIRLYIDKHRRRGESSESFHPFNLKHRPYQDIIINNKLIVRGHGPKCASRYDAIKTVLNRFKRPITILDIGAASGYMAFRIANDYPSTCVMVSDPTQEDVSLKKLCELNTSLDNVILLSKRVTAHELKLMSEREHFDVVLALNVLHHFPCHEWKEAAEAILNLGDCVIIETPPIEDKKTCGQDNIAEILDFIERHDSKLIAKTRRHTSPKHFGRMYLLKGPKKILNKINVFDSSMIEYNIYCDFIEKYLIRKNDPLDFANRINCPKGISLITFKMLNGTYPTKKMIKHSIAEHIYRQGSVLLPESIIVQGKNIALFDDVLKENKNDPQECMKLVYNIVDADNMKHVFAICMG